MDNLEKTQEIVDAIRNKMEQMQIECEQKLEEGYDQAWSMLQEEQKRVREIFIHEFHLTFEFLGKAMNLPADAKVVAIQEVDNSKQFKIRVASTKDLPEQSEYCYQVPEFSQLGDIFREPDKYKVSNKGVIRGA